MTLKSLFRNNIDMEWIICVGILSWLYNRWKCYNVSDIDQKEM